MDTRNTGNVIGGHKANLSNPNTSRESKQHSKEVLSNLGTETSSSSSSSSNISSTKAAAKDNLAEVGVDTARDGDTLPGPGGKKKNKGNVIGGYKATINNPNVSEEAKEHAKEVLDEIEWKEEL